MSKKYEIKPLVWYKRLNTTFPTWETVSKDIIGTYRIWRLPGGVYRGRYALEEHIDYGSLEEAKMSFQIHYEKRLASTILKEVK